MSAHMNALIEEGTRDDLVRWLIRKEAENARLRGAFVDVENALRDRLEPHIGRVYKALKIINTTLAEMEEDDDLHRPYETPPNS